MKNFIKNNLFGFLIGIILCSGVVYAVSYNAKDITYTPTDASWEVSNVSEAINELYDLSNKKVQGFVICSNNSYANSFQTSEYQNDFLTINPINYYSATFTIKKSGNYFIYTNYSGGELVYKNVGDSFTLGIDLSSLQMLIIKL